MAASQIFSNSPLVIYTKLSPNHSGKRTQNIDTISIHTMAGNLTIESCGNLFAKKDRKASSNYGIDSNGRVGMYVEECNRSWCTSSALVDQRAVTIEVASLTSKDPYKCSDKAYETLINLCADICKRNNIKELKWKNDKSLLHQPDKQNLVPHRWLARKDCPGLYLFSHFGDIANKVNAILNGNSKASEVQEVKSSNTISNSNEKVIWNYLKEKGLSEYAVAGVMGNMFAESGLIPNNLQNSFNRLLNMSDEEYTKKVDDGSYKNFTSDKAGYGLCQWTLSSRKEKLYNFAKQRNVSISDMNMQLDFLWNEMQDYLSMMKVFNIAKSVKECSDAFLTNFERPADMSDNVKSLRASYAEDFHKKNHKENGVSELPYKVKVNDPTGLNIRKGPGTNFDIVGKITDNGIYTIIEEADGKGAKRWGKLKSGLGFISLDYCIKLS